MVVHTKSFEERVCCGFSNAHKKEVSKGRNPHEKVIGFDERASSSRTLAFFSQKVRPQEEQTFAARMRPPTPVLHEAQYLAPQRGQLRIRLETGQPKSHILVLFRLLFFTHSSVWFFEEEKKKRREEKKNRLKDKTTDTSNAKTTANEEFLFGWLIGNNGVLGIWKNGVI